MSGKDLLKYVAFGLGGYIIYEELTNPNFSISNLFGGLFGSTQPAVQPAVNVAGQPQVVTTPTVTAPVAATVTSPATVAPVTQPTAVISFSALQKTAQAAASAGESSTLTADQWNYYYSKVTGVTQSTDLFPVGNRGALLTIDQYAAARQQAGLTGLSAIKKRDLAGAIRSGGLSKYELATKRWSN